MIGLEGPNGTTLLKALAAGARAFAAAGGDRPADLPELSTARQLQAAAAAFAGVVDSELQLAAEAEASDAEYDQLVRSWARLSVQERLDKIAGMTQPQELDGCAQLEREGDAHATVLEAIEIRRRELPAAEATG